MPWSNQGGGGGTGGNGGGRKGGGRGARGRGALGGGGGKEPPDLDEILRRGQDRMRQVMRGGGGNGSGGGSFGGGRAETISFPDRHAAAGGRRLLRLHLRVNPDEQGIVLRFGKFDRWEPPGLHFRWPYPIEEVRLPKVTQQRTIEVGSRPKRYRRARTAADADGRRQRRRRAFRRLLAHQPRYGSGDWGHRRRAVSFQHRTARDDRARSGRERHARSRRSVEPAAASDRWPPEDAGRRAEADAEDARLLSVPASRSIRCSSEKSTRRTKSSAHSATVAAAAQEKETLIKQAQTYADQMVPRARGDADRIIAAAEGYRDQTIAEATGQAAALPQGLRRIQEGA